MSVFACIVSHAPWYQLSDIVGTVGTMYLREAYASLSQSEADYDYWDRPPCRYEIHQRFNRGDDPHLEAEPRRHTSDTLVPRGPRWPAEARGQPPVSAGSSWVCEKERLCNGDSMLVYSISSSTSLRIVLPGLHWY